MAKYILILMAFLSQVALADCKKTLKVAIVDTGLNLRDRRFADKICPTGHDNFVSDQTLDDVNGHGTHVAGLIKTYAGFGNYCFLIYKYYSAQNTGKQNLDNEVRALKEAVKQGAEVINYSGGGPEASDEERKVIKNNPNVLFVVAAGNDGKNLDTLGNEYYPASYGLPNMVVVGSIYDNGERAESSNWGSVVKAWEMGHMALSYSLTGGFVRMSGTSQATAIKTGKIVESKTNSCDIDNSPNLRK